MTVINLYPLLTKKLCSNAMVRTIQNQAGAAKFILIIWGSAKLLAIVNMQQKNALLQQKINNVLNFFKFGP